jgi:hypothetical protein
VLFILSLVFLSNFIGPKLATRYHFLAKDSWELRRWLDEHPTERPAKLYDSLGMAVKLSI